MRHILFCCVSLPLFALEPLHLRSTMHIEGESAAALEVEAQLSLIDEEWHPPVEAWLTIDRVELKVDAVGCSPQKPATSLDMAQLNAWLHKPMHLKIDPQEVSLEVIEKEAGLWPVFRGKLFASLFADLLPLWAAMVDHPLPVGEGFCLVRDSTPERPWIEAITCTVVDNRQESRVLEVVRSVERQRLSAHGAVVYGQWRAQWTVRKSPPYSFTMQERGEWSVSGPKGNRRYTSVKTVCGQ